MKTKTIIVYSFVLACHSAVTAQEADAKPWYQNGSFYGSLAGGVAVFGDGTVNVKNNYSGDADFDKKYFIDCDNFEFAKTFTADEENRLRIKSIFDVERTS